MRNSLFLPLVLLCCIPPAGFSQMDQSGLLSATSVQTTVTNYYFGKPNELTIIVSVVGYVQRPGRYEISKSVDLVNLLALAGGPTPDGTLSDVHLTRFAPSTGTLGAREIELNLDDIPNLLPSELVLHPGDVIRVTRSTWSTFRDVFAVLGYAAVMTTAIAYVIIATGD